MSPLAVTLLLLILVLTGAALLWALAEAESTVDDLFPDAFVTEAPDLPLLSGGPEPAGEPDPRFKVDEPAKVPEP